ncbi:hypothetical protein BJ138DRAFT_844792 [Hygrophoropsis aurantiaca]|uniref:Uncharacterized protein n=1 Tax=Hygrophoropsis aurantiaca TaxID=72124 RepID=A0ACB7ZX87_9AGAM|nr:hypothetical protein BJ138DRAFT_844792 [Hygrophoropsis aurantiaca]
MLFNRLLATVLLASAAYARDYKVTVDSEAGLKNYFGTLPTTAACGVCTTLHAGEPTWLKFSTGDKKKWELRFYKSSGCSDAHHLSECFFWFEFLPVEIAVFFLIRRHVLICVASLALQHRSWRDRKPSTLAIRNIQNLNLHIRTRCVYQDSDPCVVRPSLCMNIKQ